jgi:two-component system sensor histidine kinase MprB
MSFRLRTVLAVAAAVSVAIVAAAGAAYFAARNQLVGQVNAGLKAQAAQIGQMDSENILGYRGAVFNSYYQVVASNGRKQLPPFLSVPLPVTKQTTAVAAGTHKAFYADTHIEGYAVRIYTFHYTNGIAIQVAGDISDIQHALSRLRWILFVVGAAGILVATLIALFVARHVLRPVRRLTEASEYVTETRDLTSRIEVSGDDELARLATSFNTMLGALEESLRAQRQFVSDASHELRTPLTSLRTNIEVLASGRLPDGEREKLLADVVEQLDEMSTLVSELVLVARGDAPAGQREVVRLDELVLESVERARRNTPSIHFETSLYESTVEAIPAALERAIGNLLENAAKWSPPGGTVEVAVVDHEVRVRDHGPGIDEADAPFVFDRFYRAPAARNMPGSGLGLAIVRQVAESHGGEVVVERPAGGGTTMRLKLPS